MTFLRTSKKLFALLLSSLLLLSMPVCAFADEPADADIVISDAGGSVTISVTGGETYTVQGDSINDVTIRVDNSPPVSGDRITVNGTTVEESVGGALVEITDEVSGGTGAEVELFGNGTLSVQFDDSINSSDSEVDAALRVDSSYAGYQGHTETTVDVQGDVTGVNRGIYAYFDRGDGKIYVAGSVEATNGCGIMTCAGSDALPEGYVFIGPAVLPQYFPSDWNYNTYYPPGNSTITVDGDVTGTTEGISVYADHCTTTQITVGGDVSGETGIVAQGGGALDLVVGTAEEGGTVTGGIRFNDSGENVGTEMISKNTSITLWKVEGDLTAGPQTESDIFSKVLNYIVRLVSPDEGKLSATGDNGAALAINHDMETAKEGEVIRLVAPKGYRIVNAYNGEDGSKTELAKDGKGFYYTVLPGGGILLSVDLEEFIPAASSSGYYVIETATRSVELTFDLDGGKLDGEGTALVIKAARGETITLPDAPTKDGFRFVGWETEVDGQLVTLQPGDSFKVTGQQSFKAVWEEL